MKLLYLALLPLSLFAQQLQPVASVQADCGKFSSVIRTAGTFTTATVDNRQAACDGWVVSYSSNGFATVSVLLQSANLTASGAAGAFASFAGTISAGYSNPATATSCTTGTSCEIRATGYFPYVNVQITTTGTGYLQAEFHAFKSNPNAASGTGCPGTVGTPCVVVGPTPSGTIDITTSPVQVAGQDFSGAVHVLATDTGGELLPAATSIPVTDGRGSSIHTPLANAGALTYITYPFAFNSATGFWDEQYFCTSRALVTLTDATRTQLVALSGTTSVRICHIHFTTSGGTEEFTISSGTGVACGTGTAVIDDFVGVNALVMDYQPTAALRGGSGNAVCVTQSGAAQTAKVVAIYAQQ